MAATNSPFRPALNAFQRSFFSSNSFMFRKKKIFEGHLLKVKFYLLLVITFLFIHFTVFASAQKKKEYFESPFIYINKKKNFRKGEIFRKKKRKIKFRKQFRLVHSLFFFYLL